MISVVFVPRSFSKFYADMLSKKHNLTNLGEVFTPRTYPDLAERIKVIERSCNQKDVLCKINLQWLRKYHPDYEGKVFENSDRIEVIYRKDFDSQVKSLYTAIMTDSFHTEFSDTKYLEFNSEVFWYSVNYLETFNKLVSEFYFANKHRNINLVECSSLTSERLNRPVEWIGGLPEVKSETVELFNE